jgi:hypothetical protein
MNTDEFTDAAGRAGTRFSRGFDGADVSANEHRNIAVEVFLADQNDVGGLYHRIGSLDGSTKPRVSTNPNASFTFVFGLPPHGSEYLIVETRRVRY